MKFPYLISQRLYLREHISDDQNAYYNLLSNKKAVRYYGRNPLKNKDEALAEIEVLNSKFELYESIKWAIIQKQSSQYIGCVGVKEFTNPHKKGTLSCIIAPEFWGYGYAFEALSTIIKYCFDDLHLNRLQAFVDPKNLRAMLLFEKLGFKIEAIFKEYEFERNNYIDIAIWGRIKIK